jgi:predicted nucleic-acid-binding protein
LIGVDTNVLLRLIVTDDQKQSQIARDFFASLKPDSPAFISAIVLAETVWLLKSTMRFSNNAVRSALLSLLEIDVLVFEHDHQLRTELNAALTSGVGLADQMIVWNCAKAGCEKVVTFDKKAAANIQGMELLVSSAAP